MDGVRLGWIGPEQVEEHVRMRPSHPERPRQRGDLLETLHAAADPSVHAEDDAVDRRRRARDEAAALSFCCCCCY